MMWMGKSNDPAEERLPTLSWRGEAPDQGSPHYFLPESTLSLVS